MSNQLPMAINPSIEPKQHILENLLNCFTFVDIEKQLVIAYPVFLHLGYTKESAQDILSTPMVRQYTNCKGFVPREDFFINIAQIGELIVNAPKTKYVSYILEFVKNVLIPLFNQQQQLIEHNDFIALNHQNNQPLTMSSLEIAEMCEKEHKHVMRDIKTMLENLEISSAQFWAQYKTKDGRMQPCFNLDKEMSLTLVTGYNVKLRHKIIKRWQELENQLANIQPQIAATPIVTVPALPTASTKVNASFLKLAVKQIDAMKLSPDSKQVLKAQLLHDHAGLSLELMLPVTTEQKLSPSQIAERLKVSPQKIGRIISLLGFRGKDDYCEGRLSKAKNGSKEVVQYFYTEQAVQLIKQTLEEKQQHEKTN